MTVPTTTTYSHDSQPLSWPGAVTLSQAGSKPLHILPRSQHSPHIEIPAIGSRKKVRESCNNCAQSKVRCSKERPVCARCEDRGLFCRYSLSRRTGKRGPSSSSSLSDVAASTVKTMGTTPPRIEVNTHEFHAPQLNANCLPHIDLGQDSLGFSDRDGISMVLNTPVPKRLHSDTQMEEMLDNSPMSWGDTIFSIDPDSSSTDTPNRDHSMGAYADFGLDSSLSNNMTPSSISDDSMASLFAMMGPEIPTPTSTVSVSSPANYQVYDHQYQRSPVVSDRLEIPMRQPQPAHRDSNAVALNAIQSLYEHVSSLDPRLVSSCRFDDVEVRRKQAKLVFASLHMAVRSVQQLLVESEESAKESAWLEPWS
jgi:hypothetical protein